MNPQITQGGRSFKGAFLYYMHDKGGKTRERIAWTHTHNMITDDPDKAWKVMAYTAKAQDQLKLAMGHGAGGQKCKKPVMAYSLNWHPNETPSPDHMRETAIESLKVLGLEEHEALIVAHSDTAHRHVHIIANRIHPLHGLVASDSNDYHKLSAFARQYAKEHNLNYSPQREINHTKREKGEFIKHRDPHIAEAWDQSDNGKSFASALEAKGYHIAQGRKRVVVIDPYGKIINPIRQIEGVRAKCFKERISDLPLDQLPEATALAAEIAAQHEQKKKATSKRIRQEFTGNAAKPTPDLKASYDAINVAPPTPLPEIEETPELTPEEMAIYVLNKKHDDELEKVRRYHGRRISHEQQKLSAFYKFDERKRSISELEAKCDKPSLWRKITGQARRDREHLSKLKLGYADAKMRYSEKIDQLKNEQEKALNALRQRQRVELDNGPIFSRETHIDRNPRIEQSDGLNMG